MILPLRVFIVCTVNPSGHQEDWALLVGVVGVVGVPQ